MNLIAKLRKVGTSKKGFTLVELIVVLVILAILLAILVPSLIGWINKARDRGDLVEARQAYLAAQTLAEEAFGRDPNAVDETDGALIDDIMALAFPNIATNPIRGVGITTVTIGGGDVKVFEWEGANTNVVLQNGSLVQSPK